MLSPLVFKVQKDVYADKRGVEQIEDQDIIHVKKDLGRHAEQVTDEDQNQKREAFPLGAPCAVRFQYVDGPRNAETYDHSGFQNALHPAPRSNACRLPTGLFILYNVRKYMQERLYCQTVIP